MERKHLNRKVSKIGMIIFSVVFVLLIILPFVWLALAAFKNMRELYASPVQILPSSLSLDNFIEAFTVQPMAQYILNSVIVSLVSTVLIIVIGCMASFSLARTKIKGKRLILLLLLTITLLPPITLLNPIYLMMSKMGLLNTRIGLALVLVAIELPSAVWYLMTFFQTIPDTIEESAMIDGATIPQTFVKILLPVVRPGIFTISIMTFINTWNNYIFPLVLNPTKDARVVTVALTMYSGDTYTPWNLIAAAAIVASIPLIIMVLAIQKRIISGMMDGAVKG
ncbi:MAG TPA: carbohydrate ABC transporter permease [Candidatus Mediterraneibacter norfolkensis]|nr:carbohydrate ABC transporter permease [Candidatus Mediterraneibacter norfolkensis]